jgi:signal transduction histidine kinase
MSAWRALVERSVRLRGRRGTLPLRLWLVFAVVAVAGAGFLAQVTMTTVVAVWQQQVSAAQLASVEQVIGADPAHWSDPTWQRRAQQSLSALGVEAAVFQDEPARSGAVGPLLFATPGARQLWDSSGPGVSADSPSVVPDQPTFQRLVIATRATGTPIAIALLWYTRPLGGRTLNVLWPLVELGTFALTLAIVVWLVGQPVLRPLAALSQAAEDMAGGDLQVHLPPSPVREIADVGSALEGMSAGLREALARQESLEQERLMFVGAIAHDLRTPLFLLRGYLKGLESGVAASPEKMAHYVAICQTQATVLERLVSDLFAYTRLEHLEMVPERAPFELGTLLRETVEAAMPLAATKHIALMADLATDDDAVVGDSHLLTRVVENLLDNAVRHTPEGGAIRVRVARKAERLIFTVADSGQGIALQDMPHLFTPLYRGDASRNRQTGGLGLGLAIARRIMEAHGGTLAAANGADGGAVFTGTLPAARQPAAQPGLASA